MSWLTCQEFRDMAVKHWNQTWLWLGTSRNLNFVSGISGSSFNLQFLVGYRITWTLWCPKSFRPWNFSKGKRGDCEIWKGHVSILPTVNSRSYLKQIWKNIYTNIFEITYIHAHIIYLYLLLYMIFEIYHIYTYLYVEEIILPPSNFTMGCLRRHWHSWCQSLLFLLHLLRNHCWCCFRCLLGATWQLSKWDEVWGRQKGTKKNHSNK